MTNRSHIPPLSRSLRDRVAVALHVSRRNNNSTTISVDVLPYVREMANAFLEACRQQGVSVALDDGAGEAGNAERAA